MYTSFVGLLKAHASLATTQLSPLTHITFTAEYVSIAAGYIKYCTHFRSSGSYIHHTIRNLAPSPGFLLRLGTPW